jgi:hypothetical protein
MLLDNRSDDGRGFCVRTAGDGTAEGGTVEIVLADGRTESRWSSDPGLMTAGTKHRVAIIIDGGPKVILFVVDGLLCDGGDFRQFGWGRYNRDLRGVDGCGTLRIGAAVASLRIYDRSLRVSEAIADSK